MLRDLSRQLEPIMSFFQLDPSKDFFTNLCKLGKVGLACSFAACEGVGGWGVWHNIL